MTAVAILSVLLTVTIIGTEIIRHAVDRRLLDVLAADLGASIDDLYFLTWDDLRERYELVARRITGLAELNLLPREGHAALKRVEKRLASDPDAARKLAIINNALETFPTTFDVYRFSAAGRALIAAIAAGVALAGTVRPLFVIIILSVVLLTTLPDAVMSTSVLLRIRRQQPGAPFAARGQ